MWQEFHGVSKEAGPQANSQNIQAQSLASKLQKAEGPEGSRLNLMAQQLSICTYQQTP